MNASPSEFNIYKKTDHSGVKTWKTSLVNKRGKHQMLPCCHGYLTLKAFWYMAGVSFLHQQVSHANIPRLRGDVQVHTHDAVQDGVEGHDGGSAARERLKAVPCSTAPALAQNQRLRRRTHACNAELLRLQGNMQINLHLKKLINKNLWIIREKK